MLHPEPDSGSTTACTGSFKPLLRLQIGSLHGRAGTLVPTLPDDFCEIFRSNDIVFRIYKSSVCSVFYSE